MDRLCDEVLQLIFYELTDPSPLTFVSQRLHRFSQDPYVRAHYFLTHYGPTEAMYYALGRGKVMTERVLDILLSSGAHLSRYLIQIAIHHYFHTQAHFIKSPWVRNVPLRVFAYFLKLAEEKYGEIPRGKGEDDGSVFTMFLKEARFPPQLKSITWENVKEIMDTYNFIPFCSRDPIMSQFPLALAIEPRLLPHAAANGFSMDYKYRDFVFRKMFERPTVSSETRTDDIAENVRELCKLDPTMFVSRTVAAEVCMEVKANDIGYAALKLLDKSGHLRFELSTLVEDLLRTFLTTRSICSVSTGDILLHLFTDFPSTDVAVRLVILIVIFIAADNLQMTTSNIRAKLELLNLAPMTRRDAFNVLINPFVERYGSLVEFARTEIGGKGDGIKGMSNDEIVNLVEDVAAKCLDIACKGKFMKKLYDGFPVLKNMISRLVLQKYQISVQDVPSWEDGPDASAYVAKLCRDFLRYGVGEVHSMESMMPEQNKEVMDLEKEDIQNAGSTSIDVTPLYEDLQEDDEGSASELGDITQESLTTMIRHDEVTPVRSRRRIMYSYGASDTSGKLRYPHDPTHIGRWAKGQFGAKSSVTAVFMTHAVINDNCGMLHHYLMYADGSQSNPVAQHVPVTFKHFQILARLGRTPNFYLYHDIEVGAEFYLDENDYISKNDSARILLSKQKVKVENPPNRLPSASPTGSSSNRGKKRPRRSAAVTVRSYAVPDSDDEAIVDSDSYFAIDDQEDKKKRKETSLQLWIKHLSELLKAETRKYTDKKKRLEKASEPDAKFRMNRNDFVKSLTTNLRTLRKIETEHRMKYFGYEEAVEDYSDDEDDDDYMTRRTKKRKATHG
ncbi:hypothetical protein B0H34DRAFT_443560 [Crassisporium funariophilum]|nr:hypothetical protein B0H34DRAFT_443560 [Crassisporium funariophilum]